MEEIKKVIEYARETGLFPDTKIVEGISCNPEIVVDGRKILSFASANYLGLADDQQIKNAVIEGIQTYGLHPTGARLVSGTLDVHKKLEKETARFKGCEDSMIFATGVLANLGVIPAIMNPPALSIASAFKKFFPAQQSIIFSDELNHASIIDGCRLAKAERIIYKHCDMNDLEDKLKRHKARRRLIVTDGVFSMDGDIAPLPEIIDLARHYGAMLMVDDAHGTGVLGDSGKGTSEYFGLEDGVDIHMGTYSKAFGVAGGFIAGKHDLMDYLRITARTYIFSGATFGSMALGALKAMEIVQNEKDRRYKLWANSAHVRAGLEQQGLDTLHSKDTPIIPVKVGDEQTAMRIGKELFDEGIFAPSIIWPAVGKKQSRIRISLMATHTEEQLDRLIGMLGQLGEKYDIANR